MLGKRSNRIVAVGAAAALVGALLVAWLAPISSANPGDTQIQVLESPGPYTKLVDTGKEGFSAGDVLYEVHDVLDPADESTVGRTITRFEILRSNKGGEDFTFILDCTVGLAGGDIVFSGGSKFSDFFDADGATFAVIGGTGTYALVRGTVVITPEEVGGGEGARFVFDLTTTA